MKEQDPNLAAPCAWRPDYAGGTGPGAPWPSSEEARVLAGGARDTWCLGARPPGTEATFGSRRRGAQRSLTTLPPGTRGGSESPHVWCYRRDTTPSWGGQACRLGPHGCAAKSAKKIEGVEPHPMPQLHASLGCPNRPCGGRGHAATEKKPPPPVWPASDLKKGMTSACTSRGANVRGRGPFHSGPHPQESEWGSCQALSEEEEEEEGVYSI